MRSRWWFACGLAIVTGCGFHPSGGSDGSLDDSGSGVDSGTDATDAAGPAIDAGQGDDSGTTTCTLAPTGTTTTSAQIASSTGGSARAPMTCPTGQWPIAIAFDVTVNTIPNHGGEQVVAGITLRCGVIEFTDGVPAVIMGSTVNLDGDTTANCNAFSPIATTIEASCPAGNTIVGFTVRRPDDVLFNDVSLRCAAVSASGAISDTVLTVPVLFTGGASYPTQTVSCPTGTAMIGLTPRAACGVDGFNMQCRALGC